MRGGRRHLEINGPFSLPPNIKKQANSQLALLWVSVCTKAFSCLCTLERAAAIGRLREGTWNLLLGSASQWPTFAEDLGKGQRGAVLFQQLLRSQKNEWNASGARIFHSLLDYSFTLPILTAQPTKPSFVIELFKLNISYLTNVEKRLIWYHICTNYINIAEISLFFDSKTTFLIISIFFMLIVQGFSTLASY